MDGVVIAPSAFRHGLAEAAIVHAFTHPVRVVPADDEGFTMVVGGDETGRLLEIGFVETADETIVIVHAMEARRRFLG